MSASISCSEVLEALRRGDLPPHDVIRELGQNQPGDFYRIIVESLADSFDPAQADAYEYVMRAWFSIHKHVTPTPPKRVKTVYILSRVTLGADIKITSVILDGMKHRFPGAAIVLVGGQKSSELFAADPRVTHLKADYPRSGPAVIRHLFAIELRRRLTAPSRIVVDPDSRITQLGLIPIGEPDHYFHFPSRIANSAPNLTDLSREWLRETFDIDGSAFIAPNAVQIEGKAPRAAISFGVGENESKRIPGDFEAQTIRALAQKFRTLWIDRGVGGEEARRVTAAVEASGCADRVRFWEGSFAGFASIISQCDFYLGYDSAGQHAAAALGVPLITIFRGAPSERFRQRWAPSGRGPIEILDADSLSPAAILERL